ncbi:MAG: inorganic phosphate transporter [Bacteroidales bacterium]|nr:inorganic phosphate transporter [Bacteroidales bacterium]MCL2132834.1 inorganic phosphate transporter [Bacteroidales bacterium]
MLTLVIIGIAIALIFDFLNGMNDAANSIATIVASRVLSPFVAVLWAAFWNFAAYFLFSVTVANTVGQGIVLPQFTDVYMILSALIGAVIWVYICTMRGLPISVSHALIGGLVGSALFVHGTQALVWSGILKIALFIVLSPVIGLVLGFLLMCLMMWLFKRSNPFKTDKLFQGLQLLSSAVFSLGHGGNDAQKTMGIIAILLFSGGFLGGEFHIPEWVVFTCYTTISLGTLVGGHKVIKTLGDGLASIKPFQGFCAETSGAITLIGTAVAGIPVSTTHTITGSIIGVGVTKGFASVRWGTAANIVAAWIITIPATLVISGIICWIVRMFVTV